PAYRRQGIGSALIRGLEDFARLDQRPKTVVYHGAVDLPGDKLVPPTGSGSVPADDTAVRFLLKHGYRLEQVERMSRLPLPVPDLKSLLAAAIAETGPDYRLRFWIGPTPEQWRADVAVLGNRMSTDAPSAGLEEPEETWTVERVIAADERDKASPRTRFVAAAEHVPTGRLAGFTILSVPRQRERSVAQYATLVLREHRGHRLGMLLKVANLEQLERVAPGHPSVTTFNAEENRHMLSVNEALGFVPIASEGAWRKDL
ncbi:MAG: GNAT family N-acetyltransferase, partial [Rhodoglobus sp.]